MARAAVTLFEVGGEIAYLDKAEAWVALADQLYWDKENGGYFFTALDATDLLIRTKTVLDNATPSGNGVMVEVLARLFLLTGKVDYRSRAEALVEIFSGEASQSFPNMASLLNGWDLLQSARQLVVVGQSDDPITESMLRAAARTGLGTLVLLRLEPGEPLPAVHPAFGKTDVSKPTAYLCQGQTCGLPVYDAPSLTHALQGES
jgi:hypothetical protein